MQKYRTMRSAVAATLSPLKASSNPRQLHWCDELLGSTVDGVTAFHCYTHNMPEGYVGQRCCSPIFQLGTRKRTVNELCYLCSQLSITLAPFGAEFGYPNGLSPAKPVTGAPNAGLGLA